MANINITKNTSVRLNNIGEVRQAYAGDFSGTARGIARLSHGAESIGRTAQLVALDLKKREDSTKINDAMSKLMIGSGEIQDGIYSDHNLRPADWQNEYKAQYDKLYSEVTKELNAAQLEKMADASSRLFSSAMVGIGHGAMRRTLEDEKASSARLCAAAKMRAVDDPSEESINFYLGAFTDGEKDIVRQINALKEEGKTEEASALQESLRIRQRQGVDEILGEAEMNKIRAAEQSGDEATLEALSKRNWTKDENANASYNAVTGRTGFGGNTADKLKGQAVTALRRVRSARYEAARDEAMETETKMHLKELPTDTEGLAARYLENADSYAKLAENKNLPPEMRRSYARAAESLKHAAANAQNDAKQAPLKVKEAEQKATFDITFANFSAGADIITGEELTYADMAATARDLLISEKISPIQFHRLMGVQRREFTAAQKEFRDQVFAKIPQIMSNVKLANGKFAFSPTKKVPSAEKKTPYEVDLEHGFFNDTEAAFTYGNFVRVMNIVIEEGVSKGWSVPEMTNRFDELTDKDQTYWNEKTIDGMLNRAETSFKDRDAVRKRTSTTPSASQYINSAATTEVK